MQTTLAAIACTPPVQWRSSKGPAVGCPLHCRGGDTIRPTMSSCLTDVRANRLVRCGRIVDEARSCNRRAWASCPEACFFQLLWIAQATASISSKRQSKMRLCCPCTPDSKEFVHVVRVASGGKVCAGSATAPLSEACFSYAPPVSHSGCVRAPPIHARIIPRPRPRSRGT